LDLAGQVARVYGLSAIQSGMPSWRDSLMGMFGLLVMGRTSFEEIDLFRKNPVFKTSLGLTLVPAKETLRLYLERLVRAVGDPASVTIRASNTILLAKADITPLKTEVMRYFTVDVDVSTMDNSKSHKEGVRRT
jgi:hypothetical protein